MINLLPPAARQEIKAGRSNLLLLRYTILLAFAVVFLVVILALAYFYIGSVGSQADAIRTQNEQRAAGYSQTQADATALRSNLQSAKTLLDSNILYSKALARFAELLPQGTAITALSLNDQSFSQPTVMPVLVRGEREAIQLITTMSNSPYLTNVTVGAISTNSDNAAYPYSIEMTFTLSRSIAQ